jgi:tetratricopeptide (TPR) repeat protein
MATRSEIESLIFYVLGENNRQLLIKSGLDGVPKQARVTALRSLQDLGWIGHGGLADFEESYSLTKEGRRVAANHPEVATFDKKVQEHISALREVDGGPNGTRREALKRIISIECDMGNWDSALLNCYELKKTAERARDTGSLAFGAFHQGRIGVAQNHWDEALESYLTAIELYMEAGDRSGVAVTNNAMGVVYGNKGDHASALRCFESSISMARAVGDLGTAGKSEANLAIIYDLEGRFEESEKASRQAYAYFIEVGDVSSASRISINLSVLFMSKERYQEAAAILEKAISSARAIKNNEILGIALVDAGYCHARSGDTSKAIEFTDEAISIFREPNNLNMLALAYRNYGSIELRNYNHSAAFDWFEKSVRAAEASGVEDTMAVCCYEYGMGLISALTNLRLARKLIKKASSVYRAIGNTEKARAAEAKLAAI